MKFNKLIPELSVSNIDKSIQFYTKILGFKIEYSRKDSGFYFLSYQGSQIMLEQTNNHWSTGRLEKPFGRGINLQIETRNVKALYDSLKKKGCQIKYPLKENSYKVKDKMVACREFLVMDPDGYLLRFSQAIKG